MEVMGISGLPGSGKSLVSEIAAKKGAAVVSMGDIIREEAKKRGESSKETATNLRKEHGKYIVAQLTIEKIKQMIEDKLATTIIVEGIRSPFEVNMFKENFDNFIILSIFANPAIRFKRLQERNREDDSKMIVKRVPEVVYFPQLNALGIQGHPEWMGNGNPFVQYCTSLINSLLLNK